jgi:hypothetical protein
MRRTHLALAVLIIATVSASVSAQSVADLARKERERKKSIQSKAVLTNGSSSVSKDTQPQDVAPKPPATPAAAGTTGPTDNKGRDEKYWRAAFDKAHQDLKRAEDKLRLIDLKLNDLQGSLYRESVYNREMELREQMTLAQQDQLAARQEVDASQKKIADLEEELRRSGGPPGWAR